MEPGIVIEERELEVHVAMHAQRAEFAIMVCMGHRYRFYGFVHGVETEFLDQAVLQALRVTRRVIADAVHLQDS